MKISYRNQPVLKMLQTKFLGPVAIQSQDEDELTDELLEEFAKLWKINSAAFNQNVKVLSLPFSQAVAQSGEKLLSGDLIQKALIENTAGTIIINDRTLCYNFEKTNDSKIELTYFLFQKTPTEAPQLRSFIYSEFNGSESPVNTHSYFAKAGIYKQDLALTIQISIQTLIATLNFIKYADIQVKILPANKRVKDIRCKYVNDIDSNIAFLDSTWFTTLVKSDAFKVRGHFRLQPKKKNNEWTKELIWINDFVKTGYTAPARKLNH